MTYDQQSCNMTDSLRILHILDHSLPLHSGYAFRTLALPRTAAHGLGDFAPDLAQAGQHAGRSGRRRRLAFSPHPHRSGNAGIRGYFRQMAATQRRIAELANACAPTFFIPIRRC